MKEEEIYMQRCIRLALNGKNRVAPNPMVGAVIVYNGKIIGEGYHARCGEAHAEVTAIRSVENPALLKHSTLYVSLEPCSHYGKTPPCADLIIEKGIPRVVIGCTDPFPEVAGRGIRKLQEAGIGVTVGVLEEECKKLIAHFITFNTLHRPYILLKWAESADGFLDFNRTDGQPVKLSTDLTAMLVHKKRAEADGILVGTRTAALDNPTLTVRSWHGNNPARIVIDKHLTLDNSLHLFDGSTSTLIYTFEQSADRKHVTYITLDRESDILPQIMTDLYHRKIQTLLVEGGSKLLQSFINSSLWDEIFVEKSTQRLQSGVKAPAIPFGEYDTVEKHFNTYIYHYIRHTID